MPSYCTVNYSKRYRDRLHTQDFVLPSHMEKLSIHLGLPRSLHPGLVKCWKKTEVTSSCVKTQQIFHSLNYRFRFFLSWGLWRLRVSPKTKPHQRRQLSHGGSYFFFTLFRKRFCSRSKRMFSKSALLHRHPKQELHHHRFFKAYLGFLTWKPVRFFNASSASKKAFCSLPQ